MDTPGMVSDILADSYNNHPGTITFGMRLAEAKRIQHENKFLAERLEKVRPYYSKTGNITPNKKKKRLRLKKKAFDNY